jgi:hypothetical protein
MQKTAMREMPELGQLGPDNRILFILDGHSSRINIDAIKQAKELGVDILIFPGQCTHFLQPWDQIFAAFRKSYRELLMHLAVTCESKGGVKINKTQWFVLIDAALYNTFQNNPAALTNAFKKTGLVPLNPSIVLEKAPEVQIVAVRHQPRMDPVLKPLGPGELKKINIMLRVDDQVARLKKVNNFEKLNMLKVSRFITADEWVDKLQEHKEAKAIVEATKEAKKLAKAQNIAKKGSGGVKKTRMRAKKASKKP